MILPSSVCVLSIQILNALANANMCCINKSLWTQLIYRCRVSAFTCHRLFEPSKPWNMFFGPITLFFLYTIDYSRFQWQCVLCMLLGHIVPIIIVSTCSIIIKQLIWQKKVGTKMWWNIWTRYASMCEMHFNLYSSHSKI